MWGLIQAAEVAATAILKELLMKTYPVKDESGVQIAFEIENIYVNYGSIAELLRGLSGVKKISTRKLFSNSEYRVEFEYNGVDCVVWEPFGDNSRYWIGPRNPENEKIDIQKVQALFDSYSPNFLRKFVGDMLSCNFIRK